MQDVTSEKLSLFNTRDTVLADLKRIHRLARGERTYDTYQINFEVPSNSSNEKIVRAATPIILKDLGRTYEIEGKLEVFDAKTGQSKFVSFYWRPQKLKIDIPEEYKMKNQPQKQGSSTAKAAGQKISKGFSAVGKWLDSLPDDDTMTGDLFSSGSGSRKRSSSSSTRSRSSSTGGRKTTGKSGYKRTSTGTKRKSSRKDDDDWSW